MHTQMVESPEKLGLGRLSTGDFKALPTKSEDIEDEGVSTRLRIKKNVGQYELHDMKLDVLLRKDIESMTTKQLSEHKLAIKSAKRYRKMAEDKIRATFVYARALTEELEGSDDEEEEEDLSTKMDSMSLEELEAYMARRRTEAEGVDAEEVRMLCVCLSDLLSTLQSEPSEAEVSEAEEAEEVKPPPPKAKKIILAKKE